MTANSETHNFKRTQNASRIKDLLNRRKNFSICYHSPISVKKFKAYQSERENLQSSKYSSVKSAAQQEALENDIRFINNKIS